VPRDSILGVLKRSWEPHGESACSRRLVILPFPLIWRTMPGFAHGTAPCRNSMYIPCRGVHFRLDEGLFTRLSFQYPVQGNRCHVA
jgi:hypothetical protein